MVYINSTFSNLTVKVTDGLERRRFHAKHFRDYVAVYYDHGERWNFPDVMGRN